MNKFISILAISVAFLFQQAFAAELSPFGTWKTIDDETGKPKSIVELWEDKGELKGRIVKLLNPSEPNPVCDECSGSKKNKPIEGLEFVWGLKKDDDIWTGGKILDPANGKEYKANIEVVDGGNKLEVRGYIGFALIGRTQVWVKAD